METPQQLERVYTAMENVVELLLEGEEKRFKKYINNEDRKNADLFKDKLKGHLFYSLIVMKYGGDTKEINSWFKAYWKQNRLVNADDEP
jgi:hypothetical protein